MRFNLFILLVLIYLIGVYPVNYYKLKSMEDWKADTKIPKTMSLIISPLSYPMIKMAEAAHVVEKSLAYEVPEEQR